MVGRGIRFTMDCLREKNHCDTGQAILGKNIEMNINLKKMVLGEEVIRATMLYLWGKSL